MILKPTKYKTTWKFCHNRLCVYYLIHYICLGANNINVRISTPNYQIHCAHNGHDKVIELYIYILLRVLCFCKTLHPQTSS